MKIHWQNRQWLNFEFFVYFDKPLSVIILILLLMSTAVIYSATADTPLRFFVQLCHIFLAFLMMLLMANIPSQFLMRLAPLGYTFGLILLLTVCFFGLTRKGAQRWLSLGLIIQPSEIMKIAMPAMLAWYFQKREDFIRWYDYLIAAALVFIPVLLIVKQPDLGTALLVGLAGFYVIFLAGLSWRFIIPVLCLLAVCLILLLVFKNQLCDPNLDWIILHGYQKHRICTLLNPGADPRGKSFHIIQAIIAIGSGGIWGKGWLKGTQAHLEFIPERHTDFIFAIFSEEFGLIGVIFLLILYFLLVIRGLIIAAQGTTLFARLLASAITLVFFTYVFVNLGMVTGMLPVVGVPLPLFSYGGTALITLGIGLGILMRVAKEKRLSQSYSKL